uniref:Uncharacterized protein n=1 Tax=Oryza punctata TaxID=4537 RepID=A0A0E0MLV4_ORYPU
MPGQCIEPNLGEIETWLSHRLILSNRNRPPSRCYKVIPGLFSSKPNLPFALPSPKTLAPPMKIGIASPAGCRTPAKVAPPPQGLSTGVGGGVWRGVARVAVAAVGRSREPLNEGGRASNTCDRRQPPAAPVSTAPRRPPLNFSVPPLRKLSRL